MHSTTIEARDVCPPMTVKVKLRGMWRAALALRLMQLAARVYPGGIEVNAVHDEPSDADA